MVLFGQGFSGGELLAAETARVRSLLADMERILDGALPEAIATGEPPVLDRWILGNTLVPCLAGLSTGHPTLTGVNRAIATSPLWMMSADMTWARSQSRWYQLGRPAGRDGLDG